MEIIVSLYFIKVLSKHIFLDSTLAEKNYGGENVAIATTYLCNCQYLFKIEGTQVEILPQRFFLTFSKSKYLLIKVNNWGMVSEEWLRYGQESTAL